MKFENQFDRTMFYIPPGHDMKEYYPSGDKYQLLDISDIIGLRDFPFGCISKMVEVVYPIETGILWWSNNTSNPIYYSPETNKIVIVPYVAKFYDEIMIKTENVELDVPTQVNKKHSIFLRAKYKEDRLRNRFVRNDIYNYHDKLEVLPTIAILEAEYIIIPGTFDTAPGFYSGWLKIGEFFQPMGAPTNFSSAIASPLKLYSHRTDAESDHVDQSVKLHHIEPGIYVPSGLIQTGLIDQKSISDEIKSFIGKNKNINEHVKNLIDLNGFLESSNINPLCKKRIDQYLFKKDINGILEDEDLLIPNPFYFDSETGTYQFNLAAVANTGVAMVLGALSLGTGSLIGVPEFGVGECSIDGWTNPDHPQTYAGGFTALNPDGFTSDQRFLIVSPSFIQWGSAHRPFDPTKIEGCNFEVRIEAETGKITAWSQMNMTDGSGGSAPDFVYECPVYYAPLGVKKYESESEPTEEDIPEIKSFIADPSTIQIDDTSTLSWETKNTTACEINNGIGTVDLTGSKIVQPIETTTYELTATGPGGIKKANATITIGDEEPPDPPDDFNFHIGGETIEKLLVYGHFGLVGDQAWPGWVQNTMALSNIIDTIKGYWKHGLAFRTWIPQGYRLEDGTWNPHPWEFNRVEGKFDLSRFNNQYLDRVASFARVCNAKKVIFIADLFDHYTMTTNWNDHPLNPNHNMQSTYGLPISNAFPAFYNLSLYPDLADFQKQYVQKIAEILSGMQYVILSSGNEMRDGDNQIRTIWHKTIASWVKEINPDVLFHEADTGAGNGNDSQTHAESIVDCFSVHGLGKTTCDNGIDFRIEDYRKYGKPFIMDSDGLHDCRNASNGYQWYLSLKSIGCYYYGYKTGFPGQEDWVDGKSFLEYMRNE